MDWEGEAPAEPSCRVNRDYLMACRLSLSADFGPVWMVFGPSRILAVLLGMLDNGHHRAGMMECHIDE